MYNAPRKRGLSLQQRPECPKCGAVARWERTTTDLLLRCMCGFNKVMFTTLEELVIERGTRAEDVKLPRPGTALRTTLIAVSVLAPATSGQVTQMLNDQRLGTGQSQLNVPDVSSYLTILRGSGLVEVLKLNRGAAGGSTWGLTDAAKRLLGV